MADNEIRPSFPATGTGKPSGPEPPAIQSTIDALKMLVHIEGGYFAETDRDPAIVPSPFPGEAASNTQDLAPQRPGFKPGFRNASTTIFYLITPASPQGNFHRNRARTVHTLHRGRGRYVLIHADEGPNPRIETFVVGQNVAAGEKLQWVVEGGKYKASFLLPDSPDGTTSEGGLLISETVVPGFEYCDHDFLSLQGLKELLGEEKAKEFEWLVRKE